jgi:hypothetical protein
VGGQLAVVPAGKFNVRAAAGDRVRAIADGADEPSASDETGAGEPAVAARAEPTATMPDIPSKQAATAPAR